MYITPIPASTSRTGAPLGFNAVGPAVALYARSGMPTAATARHTNIVPHRVIAAPKLPAPAPSPCTDLTASRVVPFAADLSASRQAPFVAVDFSAKHQTQRVSPNLSASRQAGAPAMVVRGHHQQLPVGSTRSWQGPSPSSVRQGHAWQTCSPGPVAHDCHRRVNNLPVQTSGLPQGISTPTSLPRRIGCAASPNYAVAAKSGAPTVRGYPSPAKAVVLNEETPHAVYAEATAAPKLPQRSHPSDAKPSASRVANLRNHYESLAENAAPPLRMAVAPDVSSRAAAASPSKLVEELQLTTHATQAEKQVVQARSQAQDILKSVETPIEKKEEGRLSSPAVSWCIEPTMHSMVLDGERNFLEHCLSELNRAIATEGSLALYLRRCALASADDLTGSELAAADLAAQLSAVPDLDDYLAAEDPQVVDYVCDFLVKALEALIQRLCRNGSDGVFVMKGTAFSQGGKKLIKAKLGLGSSLETCTMSLSVCWDWDVRLELDALVTD